MKLWPYSLTGPEFLTVFTCAIVLGLLAWVWLRERQRGAIRDRIQDVPFDTYQLAYLRGGAVAAVDTALVGLRAAGKVTRSGVKFVAVAGATADDGSHELPRAVLDAIAAVPRTVRELAARVHRPLGRLEQQLIERGWIASEHRRIRQGLIAKLPLVAVGVAGAVRVLQGLHHARPVGFLVVELGVLGVLVAVLPRLPRRTRRGDAALAHHLHHHDALVRTARTAPQQLAPPEVALSFALAGNSATPRGASTCGSTSACGATIACGSTVGCGSSGGSSGGDGGGSSGGDGGGGSSGGDGGGGGSSCGGGSGCGGCGGGGD